MQKKYKDGKRVNRTAAEYQPLPPKRTIKMRAKYNFVGRGRPSWEPSGLDEVSQAGLDFLLKF